MSAAQRPVHDMGGRMGDGPVPETDDGLVFHSEWEARALALTVLSGAIGAWGIDSGRFARESLAPEDYERFTYYEKWSAALADCLVSYGVVTEAELKDSAKGQGASPDVLDPRALPAAAVLASQRKVAPYTREAGPAPQFADGTEVITAQSSPNPGGHTRLPSYAMGKRGRILACRGNHVFPDSRAHSAEEAPEPLYTVVFQASELWPGEGRAGDEVTLDLWQSYLSAAE